MTRPRARSAAPGGGRPPARGHDAPAPAGPAVPPARAVDRAVAAVLLLATLALYAPVRDHAFLNYDDTEYVTEHPRVRAGLTRAGVAWALTGVHQATWHPLTSLTHLLDVQLFGLDAGPHLLVNVLLHACATAVLFLVLRSATGARWPSAFVAAAFAWHPLRVESVAWVSERKDVLSGLFWMLTLAAYVGYARRPTWGRWFAIAAVFTLGLLAKPMLVTLPCVLLLLDLWPLGRVPPAGGAPAVWRALVREKLPLFGLAAAMSAATVLAQRSAGALTTLATAPFGYRVGNALVSYVAYLRKILWPTGLAVFYPPREDLSVWAALAAAALVAAVTVAVLRAARRAPYLLVGWLWYLGTLVPVIGLVRHGEQAMADRFTYLPSIGIFMVLAWAARELAAGARPRVPAGLATAGGALALAACVAATARQLDHWRDSVSLFTHALAVAPDNYVAHGNLGVALDALGRHTEAMAHFERAVALAPSFAKARLNLGNALARSGSVEAAEAEYREAVRLDPGSALASYDLGLLLAERGELAEAIAWYRRALDRDPRYARAWNNLGWALAARGAPGDLAEAVRAYERALAMDPDLTAAHNNLAVALEGLGRGDEALAHYAAAVRLAPDEPRAHANHAALLASLGRTDEAIASYREALRLAPELAEVRAALAELLARRAPAAPAPTPGRGAGARRGGGPAFPEPDLVLPPPDGAAPADVTDTR
ncbi:MAG: tetratricopeptide repeat protein [Deltaproteobacteria bacterium]|nr:tetratricopeptide repeat protein [Deltaproteobacteria bacterium]